MKSIALCAGARHRELRIESVGLVGTILTCLKAKPDAVPMAVGLYITAAYWFTSSTSFANPAGTIARGFSDTVAGINPAKLEIKVPGFGSFSL